MSWSRVSFASWSTTSLPSMPQWLGTQQMQTHVPLSLSALRRFMIWQMRGFSVSSPLIKTLSPSRIQHRAVQGPCAYKDGAVIRESLGQLVAGRLTILEMAVDDRCSPNPLVNLRSISVDFIVWSSSIMILSEFGLSLFSSDHTFTHFLNEVIWRGLNSLTQRNMAFTLAAPAWASPLLIMTISWSYWRKDTM